MAKSPDNLRSDDEIVCISSLAPCTVTLSSCDSKAIFKRSVFEENLVSRYVLSTSEMM